MMHKDDVKLLTDSVMLEDMDRGDAEEAAAPINDHIMSVSELNGEKDYKAGVIDLRNSRELSFIVNDPVSFKAKVASYLMMGSVTNSIRLEDAARCVAIINVVRSATTTAEPMTIFDVFEGARLAQKKLEDEHVIVDYDKLNTELCKSIAESVERMIDAVSVALKDGDMNDKSVIVGYGQVLSVLRNLTF